MDTQETTQPTFTKGYKAFASFEFQGTENEVNAVRTQAAILWDLFDQATYEPGSEAARYYATAKTNLEQAVMWFTKGASRSKAQ